MSRTHDARGAVGNHSSGANGAHAVVVGGSMAGLLAARVLANHFEQVTIVERDALSDTVHTRKGVGAAGQHLPTDEAGFAAFARSLRHPIIADALAAAEPVTLIRGYRGTVNGGGTTSACPVGWNASSWWVTRSAHSIPSTARA
ncbi:MAG: hypothetical protein JWM45_3746 [Pseudonocardiales bacterium]|nr:hypothetical protein [Pseudonocardiales bacterium]